ASDRVEPGELVLQAGPAATGIFRPGGARRRGRGALAPSPAGRLLGDRGAEGGDRGGAAGRVLRAPGRRLRREVRGLPVRLDHQEAEDPAADEPGAPVRTEEAGGAYRAYGRPVRQTPLGGHRDARWNYAAVLPRRHRQPARVRPRRPRTGPAAPAARL